MNISELFSLTDILWHLLNTALLFIGLRLLLYKPVRKFMDGRAQRLRDAREAADRSLAEAREHEAEARALADGAKAQADAALAAGAAEAKAQADTILAEAHAEADAILAQAHAEAEELRRRNADALQKQSVAMAMDISAKILEREIKPEDHRQMIEDFLTKVE